MRLSAGRFGFGRKPAREPVSAAEADWASLEIGAWNGRGVTAGTVAAQAERVITARNTFFRIDILGPSVKVGSGSKEGSLHPMYRTRAEAYRRVFEDVVRTFGINIHVPIILETNDLSGVLPDVPVMAFQKPCGHEVLLLPDIELIHGYNTQADVQDDTPWAQKLTAAIFTGSTSGGWSTEESVRERRLPRLAAAEYFRDSPRVRWELPGVVQCETPAAADLIRSLGFGGERRTWKEQLAYKVLLSMDGNGATCSRVSIGLASDCLLAKFQSPHVLYYFRGLAPGEHFAPVAAFEDVDRLLDALEAEPASYEAIALAGKAFAHRHLSRISVFTYVAELLLRYDRLLRGEAVPRDATLLSRQVALAELVATSNDGSRRLAGLNAWAGAPRSRLPLKRLALHLAPGVPADAIRLAVVDAAGAEMRSTPLKAEVEATDGGFLHGVGVEVDDAKRDAYAVKLDVLYLDGRQQELRAAGPPPPPRQIPVEAVRLAVTPR